MIKTTASAVGIVVGLTLAASPLTPLSGIILAGLFYDAKGRVEKVIDPELRAKEAEKRALETARNSFACKTALHDLESAETLNVGDEQYRAGLQSKVFKACRPA